MNRIVSIGLLVIGLILLLIGLSSSDSFASEFSEFFTGSPTHESIWLMLGGGILAIVGLAGLSRGAK